MLFSINFENINISLLINVQFNYPYLWRNRKSSSVNMLSTRLPPTGGGGAFNTTPSPLPFPLPSSITPPHFCLNLYQHPKQHNQ